RERIEIPLVIGGKDVKTGETFEAVMPHRKGHVLADVHSGGPAQVEQAISAAREARHDWNRMPWEERAAIFLRAAELPATARRAARPVEDGAPGGDRRRLRADRLLALQRR